MFLWRRKLKKKKRIGKKNANTVQKEGRTVIKWRIEGGLHSPYYIICFIYQSLFCCHVACAGGGKCVFLLHLTCVHLGQFKHAMVIRECSLQDTWSTGFAKAVLLYTACFLANIHMASCCCCFMRNICFLSL